MNCAFVLFRNVYIMYTYILYAVPGHYQQLMLPFLQDKNPTGFNPKQSVLMPGSVLYLPAAALSLSILLLGEALMYPPSHYS